MLAGAQSAVEEVQGKSMTVRTLGACRECAYLPYALYGNDLPDPERIEDAFVRLHNLSWLSPNGTAAIVCFPGIWIAEYCPAGAGIRVRAILQRRCFAETASSGNKLPPRMRPVFDTGKYPPPMGYGLMSVFHIPKLHDEWWRD